MPIIILGNNKKQTVGKLPTKLMIKNKNNSSKYQQNNQKDFVIIVINTLPNFILIKKFKLYQRSQSKIEGKLVSSV